MDDSTNHCQSGIEHSVDGGWRCGRIGLVCSIATDYSGDHSGEGLSIINKETIP